MQVLVLSLLLKDGERPRLPCRQFSIKGRSCSLLVIGAESALVGVDNVEEAIWVLSPLVDLRHQSVSLQDDSIGEEVEGVFLGESDPLPDNEPELISG